MSTALVVGLGDVGVRAARQLLESDGIDAVRIAARDHGRVTDIVASLGPRAQRIDWVPGAAVPAGVDVVVSAVPADLEPIVIDSAVRSGVPAAGVADTSETLDALLALDGEARQRGVTVVAGAGLAPGLSCVLARHAASLFDDLIEVRVARAGMAGDASERAVRDERRPMPSLLRDRVWEQVARLEEVVWFPEPIGARECQMVRAGGPLLARALGSDDGGLDRLTWSLAEPVRRRSGLRRVDADDGWGAIRVEVFGRRGGAVDSVVYGVVDRTALAAGVVLAAAAVRLVRPGDRPAGVHSLAALVDPVELLGDLAARGVRAAAFVGAPAI